MAQHCVHYVHWTLACAAAPLILFETHISVKERMIRIWNVFPQVSELYDI